MDIQFALLSKIVLDADIKTAVNSRITADFFTDDRYRRIYEYCLEHWRRHGTAPDESVVQLAFPSYNWKRFGQPIDYFIERIRERRKRALLTDALQKAAVLLNDTDPDAVDLLDLGLRDALLQVRLETTPTLDSDTVNMRTAYLPLVEERMLNPGRLRGISTGFSGIDYVTGGFQPEQFVVLLGLPKALKSSTLLWMAMKCQAQARVAAFIGFEMSEIEQQDRMVSLLSGVGLTQIMTGNLTVAEYRRVEEALVRLENMRSLIISTDIANATTVSGVQAKIMEYNPDVVFIDGAYLMQSELPKAEPGSPQALTDIARGLKKLAQSQRVPIVVTTQASATRSKGGKLNMYSAMYTQAWGQSADVLLGVERVDEAASDTGEIGIRLKVLTSRSGPRAETVLVWDWSKGAVTEMDPANFRQPASALDDDDD